MFGLEHKLQMGPLNWLMTNVNLMYFYGTHAESLNVLFLGLENVLNLSKFIHEVLKGLNFVQKILLFLIVKV